MAEIVHLHDEEGFSYSAISDSVERRLCEYEGREFKDSASFKRKWAPSKCRRAYFTYQRILQAEGPKRPRTASPAGRNCPTGTDSAAAATRSATSAWATKRCGWLGRVERSTRS